MTAIPSIRQNLVAALKARKFSAHKVGALIDIDHSSINRWRKGETFPTPENLERLAEALGCDPLELLMTPEQRRLWQALQALQKTD